MRYQSILSFYPLTVTLITTVVYLLITVPLVVIHETVPTPPKDSTLPRGLNLTEAWFDLDELSNGYHPFNSRRNDEVRKWLLFKIKDILNTNKIAWMLDGSDQGRKVQDLKNPMNKNKTFQDETHFFPEESLPKVYVFDDLTSNYTSTALTGIGTNGRKVAVSTYFEGSNIIVYIKGEKDKAGNWWKSSPHIKDQHDKRGVMINAHIDSVSTGYGATDDGVGVVTALQLLNYFSTKGNEPERGIVLLFNNNEEDGLYGARAFLSHPMASFVQFFLNLEGAGAGGRATLFRSTDLEVTRAFSYSPHPFGNVVSADGFSLKFVRSDTDYTVFRAKGYHGLDFAFWGPRSRYHTDQDDAKHTSKASLWHMLSTSIEALKYLTSNEFHYSSNDVNGEKSEVNSSEGSDGVWFDLFGRFFVVFGLRTLFAWSLSVLIATPLILLVTSYLLTRQDKYYLFSNSVKVAGRTTDVVNLQGWSGLFRFPIVFLVSSTITFGAAFLLREVNPFIIYSSQYSVWSMFISLFFCTFWFQMAGCNAIRPSALQRIYVLSWMYLFGWVILIIVTVFEDRFQISSGYIFVFNQIAIFLATLVGLCDLFALPTKTTAAQSIRDDHRTRDIISSPTPEVPCSSGREVQVDQEEQQNSASEASPLLGGDNHPHLTGTTFSRGYQISRSNQFDDCHNQVEKNCGYGREQKWSASLPSLTWLPQFLILAPFPLIIFEQVGLLLVSATSQTGADGSALIFPYLIAAVFSVLLILPLAPFIHRVTYHIPLFFSLIFIGTLIYNLNAFPFSAQNRYKIFFQQTVDLDSGGNRVTLAGIEVYVRDIISYLPSAAGQLIDCTTHPEIRSGLSFCSYEGELPNIYHFKNQSSPENRIEDWLIYNVTRIKNENKAIFEVSGRETKACAIRFNLPFSYFHVHGAAPHHRYESDVSDMKSSQIKLWHRYWNQKWVVELEWPVSEGKEPGEEGRSGEVVCLWSDHNEQGTIPALDELERFMPDWAVKTKLTDGLVEGRKAFSI